MQQENGRGIYRGLIRRDDRASLDFQTQVLTLKEVADELRCSKAHVCNIIHGKVPTLPAMPVVRLGRRLIVRREALDGWLAVVERQITVR
ncbi:MAG: helix-turn-helix domain-containing protein [Bryobacteraceae bacterium]|nr:helix-turn-helix domain-containing protein [Bryobacteraceae bacterium]